ncbi:MAG: galactose mutarotase [Candidatus Hydrogenedentes bacterium]|nr:galactose mutarotase [Candidatus Hydrogenedentota bacterium]
MDIIKDSFGITSEGEAITLYTLSPSSEFKVAITNYGGIIVSIITPDRDGTMTDIVLGFDDLESYIGKHPYFGAVVGRYGNRIANGKFTLDNKEYTLAQNNSPNHLHGGVHGFDKAVWQAEPLRRADAVGLKLTHTSPDGNEGYPGTLQCEVIYWVTQSNTLEISYKAVTDAPTHVNLTNHSYFNLAGHDSRTILDHEMTLYAEYFLPIDDTSIPTGLLQPVANTPMDFRKSRMIGDRIEDEDEQLLYGIGYDHTFVIDPENKKELRQAAQVYEPIHGRVMDVWTTEPGVQFYSGNFLDSTNIGKGGMVYKHRYGFCLETQHFPDTPNHTDFPSTVLRPGEIYQTRTEYRFSTK